MVKNVRSPIFVTCSGRRVGSSLLYIMTSRQLDGTKKQLQFRSRGSHSMEYFPQFSDSEICPYHESNLLYVQCTVVLLSSYNLKEAEVVVRALRNCGAKQPAPGPQSDSTSAVIRSPNYS